MYHDSVSDFLERDVVGSQNGQGLGILGDLRPHLPLSSILSMSYAITRRITHQNVGTISICRLSPLIIRQPEKELAHKKIIILWPRSLQCLCLRPGRRYVKR